MKLIIILGVLFFVGCQKKLPDKPLLTLSQFDKESNIITGVLRKIISDEDSANIHYIALGLESSFTLDCVPIGEECTEYHKILTQLIQLTLNKKISDAERNLVIKMFDELLDTLKLTLTKLIYDWKNFN